MMRDVEIVAVCYIFIGIFGVIGNGMIVISLGKVSNALWFASQKDHFWLVEQYLKILQACFLKISSMTEGRSCTASV